MKRLIILTYFALLGLIATAQNVTLTFRDTPLPEALRQIDQSQSEKTINFFYDELEHFRITKEIKDKRPLEAVRIICDKLPVSINMKGSDISVNLKKEKNSEQLILSGRVYDQKTHLGLLGATVQLLTPDSIVIDQQAASHHWVRNGQDEYCADFSFIVPKQDATYIVRASYVGYKTASVAYTIGDIKRREISREILPIALREDSKVLEQVDVTASGIVTLAEGDVVWITRSMRRGATTTGQLLGKLPGFSYNRMSTSLSYYGDENVIILVDSVERSLDYIKNLHHMRFDRIDISPNPNGKYEGYAAVVNMHTKPDYEGYETSGGPEAEFFPDGRNVKDSWFSNSKWREAFTYTKNKWNFVANYDGHFDHQERDNQAHYFYPLHGYEESVIRNTNGEKNQKSYDRQHTTFLATDYQISKSHSLSLAYSYGWQSHDQRNQITQLTRLAGEANPDTVLSNRLSDETGQSHKLAIFYRGQTKAWNYDADFNLVANPASMESCLSKSTGYNLIDNRTSRMHHTLFRASANRRFFSNRLFLGLHYQNLWKRYRQYQMDTDELISRNILRQNELRTNLSYSFSRNTNLGLNLSVLHSTVEHSRKETNFYFNPGASFFQRMGKDAWLRINYSTRKLNPNLSQVSVYSHFTDSLRWFGGNPDLTPSITHNFNLRQHFLKFFTINAHYALSPNAITNITQLQEKIDDAGRTVLCAATSPQNARWEKLAVGLYYEQKIRDLNLSANVDYNYTKGSYHDFSQSLGWLSCNAMAEYFHEPWNLYLSAAYNLSSDYSAHAQRWNKTNLDLLWIYIEKGFLDDRLNIAFNYVIPFHIIPGNNTSQTITPALVETHNRFNYNAMSNHNFELKLTYRFQGGKSVKKYNREMSDEI